MRLLLGAVVAIVTVLAVVVARRPSEFRVVRTATIGGPPASVFAQVNDFHLWDRWSPYAQRDPGMTKTYEGPPAGVGAVYTWSGNREVGEGRATIIESRPHDVIRIRLEFVRPFAGTSTATFTFAPADTGTVVSWSLDGTNSLVAKAMGLFIDMDRMIGGDFEKGLAQMRSIVEGRS